MAPTATNEEIAGSVYSSQSSIHLLVQNCQLSVKFFCKFCIRVLLHLSTDPKPTLKPFGLQLPTENYALLDLLPGLGQQ